MGRSVLNLTLQPQAPAANTDLIGGLFNYRNYFGGLSLHGGRFTELQDLKNCFELPPGISFNLVFEGSVDFVLAGTQHRLTKLEHQALTCYGIAIARPELMTRQLHKGATVGKLNIFAERDWLESRCRSGAERARLDALFELHGTVSHWEASSETLSLMLALIRNTDQEEDFCGSLQAEAMTIQLLSDCLSAMQSSADYITDAGNTPLMPEQQQIKKYIDQHLQENLALPELANQLNMSVSTLQRQFKAAYGMTVVDYIRQRRLGLARTALIEQGLSVGQAAYMAGYRYPSNFVAAFKKHYGMTPSKLLQTHC